jgi:hypothetical protein
MTRPKTATAPRGQQTELAVACFTGHPSRRGIGFLNSSDVARLVEEQQPDANAPCPNCGRPVDDSVNIFVEANVLRLFIHCGGSGSTRTG